MLYISRFGLVTGHAGNLAVQALFILSISSSMFCGIECVNILSMMTNGGHARIPVEFEQAVVLLCSGIPIGAINLSIVMCRHDDATVFQMIAGVVTILKSALRMYFYGWLKERQFKYERSMYKWTLKIAIYITASCCWLMLVLIQCFAWHHERQGGVHSASTVTGRIHAMDGVSILLVSRHDFDHDDQTRHIGSYFSHDISYCNATCRISFSNDTSDETQTRPILVANISAIIATAGNGYTVTYGCHSNNAMNNTFFLSQCRNAESLKFTFFYSYQPWKRYHQPFGEIRYNIARFSQNDKCEPLMRDLSEEWELHYFRIFLDNRISNITEVSPTSGFTNSTDCVPAHLEQAWEQVCFPPVPNFDPLLNVCE